MDKLFIVIPAYNEKDNIENTVNDWYPIVEKYNGDGESRLVVINDGSKDNTYEILCNLAKTRPFLLPQTKENGGHGSTVLYGYRFAIEHNADYVFQTDADGQTNPAEFEAFWSQRKEYDALIGKRTDRGDGKSRKFVENVVCILLRLIFGVKVSDANAPFRLMRTDVLSEFLPKLPKDFNIPNIMLTTYFVYYRKRVKFIEISFKPRQGGVNSLNIKKIIKIGWNAIGDFYRLRKDMHR
ncbi:MAG: glycosyltransferase family 2 protein [Eubacteriales bacterium]|nr:glycosyltransferase family 2 protein [Eubacteriales bacterium]